MNIANAVEAEFSDAEQQSIEAVPTDSPAAYSFYLRALTSRLTDGTTLVAAVEDLDRAIALDPEFALAYGEKAVRLAARGRLSPQLESEREQRAQESAEQALALDPNLAIAHTALAALHIANGRWNEAQQELEIAYEINPKDPLLLLNYGTLMRDIGEYTESVRLLEQAAALDPGANRNQLGISYRMAGDYEASRTAFQHSIELNPADPNPVGQLAYTEVAAGDYDEGLRQLQLSEDLGFAGSTFRVAQLAYAYSRIGREQDVERLFERFQEMAGATPPSDSEWVMVYLAVGEIEPAFRHLQSVADDPAGEYGVGIVQANVYSDPVLNEPRFAELRSQINSLD